jgi:hypothetical protein
MLKIARLPKRDAVVFCLLLPLRTLASRASLTTVACPAPGRG